MRVKIKIWLIALQILCCYNIFVGASLNCSNVNGNNIEQLSGTWESHFEHENGTLKYKLNLCGGLKRDDTCSNSSVCRESGINTFPLASLGSFLSDPKITQPNAKRQSFYLEYDGAVCKTVNGSEIHYRTSITFDCAKTLGSPQILTADDCSVDFEWNTNLVCKPTEYDPVKEVKCYQFDSMGDMRDLNRLIKLTGGYFAENGETSEDEKLEIYFNVCRDIKTSPADGLKYHLPHTCPDGAAACLVKEGKTYSLGRPQDALQINDYDSLSIVYRPDSGDEGMPENCDANSTELTIHFLCPRRGSSREPILTGAENCKYEITWWTEAACQDRILAKTGECKLEMAKHGVNIDLSPLHKTSGQLAYFFTPRNGSWTTETGDFKLNVCGATGEKCGPYNDTNHNAVCQYPLNNPEGYIAGLMDDYKLEYFDGNLLLTYSHGQSCNSNGFGRTSIIQFTCDQDAGNGSPEFNHEEHCTYFFDWKTSHACTLDENKICGAYDSNENLIDLSGLTKLTDYNWEVNDGMDKGVDRPKYFMNLCEPVIRKEAAIKCSPYSAVCEVEAGKPTAVSYGNYLKSNITTTQDGEITVVYEGGDECEGGKQRSTEIKIFCAPGVTTEEPSIHYKSADGCSLSILWYSAYACAEDKFTGSNCMVADSVSGHTFDLRPLIATETMYEVNINRYNFTLNVCSGLKGKPCGAGSSADVGVCQTENQGHGRSFVLGKPSDKLTYFDGNLQLWYDDGDAYNDGENHRKTQISFHCDKTAGKGQPMTVHEEDHTYWIDWNTSYACAPENQECSVTDPATSDHYNLQALTRSVGNWFVVGDKLGSDKRRKYYLNICKSINFVTLGNEKVDNDLRNCSVETGMCETTIGDGTEHVTHPDGGSAAHANITVTSRGHLLMSYVDGEECGDSGGHRSTNIHLICDENEENSKPRFTSSDDCTTDFTWFTKHACPTHTINSTDSDQCQINVHGHVFDLKSLSRDANDPYMVNSTDGSTYEMNICGGARSCGDATTIHACKRDNKGEIQERLPTLSNIEYTTEDNIQLRYTSTQSYENGKFAIYVVTFVCDRDVTSHEVITEESGGGGDERRFMMRTSVVCPPQQFTCDDVTDKFGGVYDLRPIAGKDVDVYNNVMDDFTFHLRLCGDVEAKNCPSGNQVCMVDSAAKGFGLGTLQSAPSATTSGNIVMDYRNGDICAKDNTRRYSATVTLLCGTRAGDLPVLLRTDDPCHYDFEWSVVTACPVHETRGSACVVTDPVYGMTFDLSSLKSDTQHEIVTGDAWNYKLNVCGQIHCDGCGCENAGVCKTTPAGTESFSIGVSNDQLTYNDGELYLKYNEGTKCGSDGETTSSKIRFLCSHDDKPPSFVEKSSDSCTYLFEWPTPLACPPVVSTECAANDTSGETFDLSVLQPLDVNNLVGTSGDTDGKLFYVNVCRSLIPQPGLACSPNSAACIKTVNSNGTTSYISAGRIDGPPAYTDGHFQLTYPEGDSCPHELGRNYTTTITFLCDDHTRTPLLVSEPNSCHIEIIWRTTAACASSNKITNDGDCTAVNPITDTSYNLTSLSRKNITAYNYSSGKHFNLNICEPADGCPAGSGICEPSEAVSYGKASSNLVYSDGSLSLHYSNGDTCPADPARNLSTTISFTCHRSGGLLLEAPDVAEEPTVVSDDDCEARIVWRTFEACELQHSCTVAADHNSRIIDLSPLVQERGHYVTYKSSISGSNTGVYFISICRPLEPLHGVKCPPGAAVCEIGSGTQPQSRGHIDPRTPLMTYDDGKVILRYESSTTCPTNKSVNVSSKIIFTCDPNEELGVPVFRDVTSDCVHLFEWATNITCKEESKTSEENQRCTYKSDVSDYIHDISTYPDRTFENNLGKLELKPCGGAVAPSVKADDPCYHAAACFTSKSDGKRYSLGETGTHTYKRIDNDLKSFSAKYIDGSSCPAKAGADKKRSLVVYYQCTLDVEANAFLSTADDCEYIFIWPSAKFCAPTTEESCKVYDVNNEDVYDFSPLSSTTHSWEILDVENRFWINLCRASRENTSPNECPADSAVCLKQQDGSYHSFGKVDTQTMIVGSRDHVKIGYSGGDHALSVCDDGRMKASTIISMECDPKISNRVVLDRLDAAECVLHVTWKSRHACHEGGLHTVKIDDQWEITDPETDLSTDLSSIADKTFVAKGDMRSEKDGPVRYNYLINLRGKPDGQTLKANIPGHDSTCNDAVVCQFKPGKDFTRKVATATQAPVYTVDDGTVEIRFTSTDKCGRRPENSSYTLIRLKCSQNDGVGVPEFFYESDDCGYYFTWHTKAACSIDGKIIADDTTAPVDNHSSSSLSAGSIFLILLVAFIVVGFTVTMIRKPHARHAVMNTCQLTPCCRTNNNPSYRYLRGDTSEDDTSLLGDDDLLMEGAPLFNRRTNDTNFGGITTASSSRANDDMEEDIFSLPDVKVRSGDGPTNRKGNSKRNNQQAPPPTDNDIDEFLMELDSPRAPHGEDTRRPYQS